MTKTTTDDNGDGIAKPKEELGRIAAEADPQARVRPIYDQYIDRVGQVVLGYVIGFARGDIFVDLGNGRDVGKPEVLAVLPRTEQVGSERYSQGERIRAVIKDVLEIAKGPQIILSRWSPELTRTD